ncbi:DUF4386 domain-containing protein [Phenylobacterium sp.]|uniref:DUF4386 domain-containing protein n=1 Tax=Phenylobacterium sp. TaxID=1871053 RepID=UPI0028A2CED9|nr:DUF4386 domain-containing protein [Phenylobacterium sp.]
MKRTARLAGLLYVLVALLTPFVLFYVPSQLYVPGDASATVGRISANQDLFVAAIVVGLVSELLFVSVILLLYRLLKAVDEPLALVMVVLIMLQVPLAILGLGNEVATLQFIRGGEFLNVFDEPQRNALAMLMINVDRQGVLISQVFWGLWLLPLGVLAFRSQFIPRLFGVWLVLNGLAYVALSAIGLAMPEYQASAFNIAVPLMFGELALAMWLLIVGIRVKAPSVDRSA